MEIGTIRNLFLETMTAPVVVEMGYRGDENERKQKIGISVFQTYKISL